MVQCMITLLGRCAQIASVGLLVLIVFSTLAPISDRPRLPVPLALERGLAFAALGFCLTIANRRNPIWIALALVALAGGLEWLQTLTATRHGHVLDFYVKAAGAILGVSMEAVAFRLRLRTLQ